MPKETILVFGSHSDDFVIGAGGTIAKYAREGKRVISIVFSYGEKSHPWIKEEVTRSFRLKEAKRAAKVLGCQLFILNFREGKFWEDYQKEGNEEKLLSILNKEKPVKIFTHSGEDPHGDHHEAFKITLDLLAKMDSPPPVYSYSVWNPVSRKTSYPCLFVDISHTFAQKKVALHCFPSQWISVYTLIGGIYFKALSQGLRIGVKYGEKFFKIK